MRDVEEEIMMEQSACSKDSELEFAWKEFVEEKQKLSKNRSFCDMESGNEEQ
jgi:hypothetical protein